jgi:hypothetical protein
MSDIGNALLGRDLGRMIREGVPQLAARVSHDPNLLAEAAFRDAHGGMSRVDFAERERQRAQQDFVDSATADLEGQPPKVDGLPSSLTPKRRAYASFNAWLKSEETNLSALQCKRDQLQKLADAPLATESDIRASLRRSADFLLGKSTEDSDTAKRIQLEGRRIEQLHQAEAARMALNDLEQSITVAELRVDRLRNREKEFLFPCVHEAAAGMKRTLSRLEAEAEALRDVLAPLYRIFSYYSMDTNEPERPDIDVRWKHSWSEISEALEADPVAPIEKLLPAVKF